MKKCVFSFLLVGSCLALIACSSPKVKVSTSNTAKMEVQTSKAGDQTEQKDCQLSLRLADDKIYIDVAGLELKKSYPAKSSAELSDLYISAVKVDFGEYQAIWGVEANTMDKDQIPQGEVKATLWKKDGNRSALLSTEQTCASVSLKDKDKSYSDELKFTYTLPEAAKIKVGDVKLELVEAGKTVFEQSFQGEQVVTVDRMEDNSKDTSGNTETGNQKSPEKEGKRDGVVSATADTETSKKLKWAGRYISGDGCKLEITKTSSGYIINGEDAFLKYNEVSKKKISGNIMTVLETENERHQLIWKGDNLIWRISSDDPDIQEKFGYENQYKRIK